MTSRRFFLAGVGATLVTSRFVETALAHVERTGLPLFEPTHAAATVTYAAIDNLGNGGIPALGQVAAAASSALQFAASTPPLA